MANNQREQTSKHVFLNLRQVDRRFTILVGRGGGSITTVFRAFTCANTKRRKYSQETELSQVKRGRRRRGFVFFIPAHPTFMYPTTKNTSRRLADWRAVEMVHARAQQEQRHNNDDDNNNNNNNNKSLRSLA